MLHPKRTHTRMSRVPPTPRRSICSHGCVLYAFAEQTMRDGSSIVRSVRCSRTRMHVDNDAVTHSVPANPADRPNLPPPRPRARSTQFSVVLQLPHTGSCRPCTPDACALVCKLYLRAAVEKYKHTHASPTRTVARRLARALTQNMNLCVECASVHALDDACARTVWR